MSDLIDRQAAIDTIREHKRNVLGQREWDEGVIYGYSAAHEHICDIIKTLPTIEERKTEWIPVKSRPMDEEERKEWSEKVGYELEGDDAVIYSQLPDDGQECIVCTKWGNVFIDTFHNDPDYGCFFEDHGDMDGITAWMPRPKPWKGGKDEQT